MRTIPTKLLHTVEIYRHASIPKYLQISKGIMECIKQEQLELFDVLPSINDLSCSFDVSRDTIEKSYKYLKDIGILGSVPSKGYFIRSTYLEANKRILLLLNKLSSHKKVIYDSLSRTLGEDYSIELSIFNGKVELFKEALLQKDMRYDYYVVIPQFVDGEDSEITEALNIIPADKLILLDKKISCFDKKECSIVYEDYSEDIYDALSLLVAKVGNYKKLNLIFSLKRKSQEAIIEGFIRFCSKFAFDYGVHYKLPDSLVSGELYICICDDMLMGLLEQVQQYGFRIGRDMGLISYNENPFKRFVLGGIATISTDFEALGKLTANIIKQGMSSKIIKVPFNIYRPQLI